MPEVTAQRGVLLDVDGTLIDSSFLHTVCWWEALRQHGRHIPMRTLARAIGMGSDVLIEHVLGETPDNAEDLSAAHGVLYRTYAERLRPLPGARELIVACAERGLLVVLSSSAKADDLERMRGILDCDDYLAHATSSADVSKSKPHPDLVGAARKAVGLRAADCIFVGDARWDVEAAARANVRCIGLATGAFSQDELAGFGAVATYSDAHDLLAHLDESPIGELAD